MTGELQCGRIPQVRSRDDSLDHLVCFVSQLTQQINIVRLRVFYTDRRLQESLLQACDLALQLLYIKPFNSNQSITITGLAV